MVELWLQMEGAGGALLVTVPPVHPPEPVAEASHAVYAALTCACVKHGLTVVGVGQVIVGVLG